MRLRAVVFDWGGTLTPWHDVDLLAQWRAYADVYDPQGAASLAARLMDGESHRWRIQLESNGATSTGALDALFLEQGIEIESAGHQEALQQYLQAWAPHTYADPDAGHVLATLKQRGYLVGVLSNTLWPRTHHEEVFARDELDPFIDAAVYTSELPVAKPHAEAFQAIATALGVECDEVAFVGDRLWDDILGASAAGMRTIWIPHSRIPQEQVPDGSARPEATAHRLLDVLAIVESWQA